MTAPLAERIAHFPTSLREHTRQLALGPAPALLVLPEAAQRPAPVLLWLHGRGVSKEIDSARFVRLMRGGIGVAAIDLPGHGERLDPLRQHPAALPGLLVEAQAELDAVHDALIRQPGVRADRLAIGGMSAGGMIALRRLGRPHPYVCAAVEGTTGDFAGAAAAMPAEEGDAPARWLEAKARGQDPLAAVGGWRPIPLLALHSEADAVVPVASMRTFLDALRARYAAQGADPGLVQLHTWPRTGAPEEHLGFGRLAGEARALQVDFLRRHLLEG